jgi:hypothetical protein
MADIKQRCDHCRFWLKTQEQNEAHLDDQWGLCKRYPPVLDLTWYHEQIFYDEDPGYSYLDYRHWHQPVTEGMNWCGEFKDG